MNDGPALRMRLLRLEIVTLGLLASSFAHALDLACKTLEDCNRAGECVAGKCQCDPGWTGPACQRLDLIAQASRDSGAAWNSHSSTNSSWCITAPRTDHDILGYSAHSDSTNATFHIFVSQMVPGCGLSTWLPGSRIVHAASNKGIEGPYEWKQQVFSSFHHNPHLTRAADGTWLLYFNGRHWPEDDFNATTCKENVTCPTQSSAWEGDFWHGGGVCQHDVDCKIFRSAAESAGDAVGTKGLGKVSSCVNGRCICEHHTFGLYCQHLTETVNLAYSDSLDGPWQNLLDDGEPFFADGNSSAHLSNPVAWPLSNGTIVMAYSRAPDLGIAVAKHWKGPYERLYLETAKGEKNYSLISPNGMFNGSLERKAEDPYLYQDKRGTWRVVFHGYGGDNRWTDGQTAYSTDLLHWTWQPEPAYSSTVEFTNGEHEVLERRERPALVVDGDGSPLYLLNGVMPSYPGNMHTYSYIHATAAATKKN